MEAQDHPGDIDQRPGDVTVPPSCHASSKPEYDNESYFGLWGLYLPDLDGNNEQMRLARAAAEEGLESFSPTKPATERDVAHWAASTLGYLTWGVTTEHENYGLGDLGGWLLDLLSAYGVYAALSPQPDLMTWLTSNIGVSDESGFGYDDVVADADAWLIAKELSAGGMDLSKTMRDLYQLSSAERISKFYNERFGSSPHNVATQFKKLVDGIDVGGVNFPVTIDKLRDAAGGGPGRRIRHRSRHRWCPTLVLSKQCTAGPASDRGEVNRFLHRR